MRYSRYQHWCRRAMAADVGAVFCLLGKGGVDKGPIREMSKEAGDRLEARKLRSQAWTIERSQAALTTHALQKHSLVQMITYPLRNVH